MTDILTTAATMIADYLLVASVIAVVLVGVAWAFVKPGWIRGPVNRYLVWLITLVGITVLPGIWLHGPKLTLAVLPAQSRIIEMVTGAADVPTGAMPAAKQSSGIIESRAPEATLPANPASDASFPGSQKPLTFKLPQLKAFLAWVWSAGFLVMLSRLLVGWHRLARLVRNAEAVPDARRFGAGLAGRADVMLTSQVDCPVCFGLLRPVILLPRQMYETSSREDLKMVLRHELAHIQRKDCLVNFYQRLIEAVLFFHPLVWYASFELTHQREQLCDNHVIAGGVSPGNYAELLTRIVTGDFEKRSFRAVALFEGRLLPRVHRLLEPGAVIQVKATNRAMMSGMMMLMMLTAVGTIRLGIQQGPGTAEIHSSIFNQMVSSEYRQEQTSKGSTEVDRSAVSAIHAQDADSSVSEPMPATGGKEVKTVLQVEEKIYGSKSESIMHDRDLSNDTTKDAFSPSEKANSYGMDFQMIDTENPASRGDVHTENPMESASLNTHVEIEALQVETAHDMKIDTGKVVADEAETKNALINKGESEPSGGNVRIPVGARIFNWKIIDRRNIVIETYFYGSFKATLAEDCPKISSKDITGIEAPWPYAVTETSTILLSNGSECRIQKLVPYSGKKENAYDVF